MPGFRYTACGSKFRGLGSRVRGRGSRASVPSGGFELRHEISGLFERGVRSHRGTCWGLGFRVVFRVYSRSLCLRRVKARPRQVCRRCQLRRQPCFVPGACAIPEMGWLIWWSGSWRYYSSEICSKCTSARTRMRLPPFWLPRLQTTHPPNS